MLIPYQNGQHVDPMLALRTVACSGRWAEAWPPILAELRARAHHRRLARRRARRPAPPAAPPAPAARRPAPRTPLLRLPPRAALTIVAGRPTADHPWKRRPLLAGGRAHATNANS